jgi:hypothetical protein
VNKVTKNPNKSNPQKSTTHIPNKTDPHQNSFKTKSKKYNNKNTKSNFSVTKSSPSFRNHKPHITKLSINPIPMISYLIPLAPIKNPCKRTLSNSPIHHYITYFTKYAN